MIRNFYEKTISLSLALFLALNSIGFASTNERVIEQKDASFEYAYDASRRYTHTVDIRDLATISETQVSTSLDQKF